MTAPTISDLSPGVVVRPILPEPVEVLTTVPVGKSVRLCLRQEPAEEPRLGIVEENHRHDPSDHGEKGATDMYYLPGDHLRVMRPGSFFYHHGLHEGGGVTAVGGQGWHASEHAGPAGQESLR